MVFLRGSCLPTLTPEVTRLPKGWNLTSIRVETTSFIDPNSFHQNTAMPPQAPPRSGHHERTPYEHLHGHPYGHAIVKIQVPLKAVLHLS